MKSRDAGVIVLSVGWLFSLAVIAGLIWQFRARYEAELVQRVWPPLQREPTVVSAQSDKQPPTVLLVGDSRLAQWPLLPPAHGKIVNAGSSSATTAQVRAALPALLQKYRPDIVVIEVGVNDLKLIGLRPQLRAAIIDQAMENLMAMTALTTQQQSRMLLLSVWPVGEPELFRRPFWSREIASAVLELNLRLAQMHAPEQGISFLDLTVSAPPQPADFKGALHFQPSYYHRLTPALLKALTSIVPK